MRVLVLRPEPQAGRMAAALAAAGIEAVAAPMLAIAPAPDALDRVAAARPEGLVFTSAHGVAALGAVPAALAAIPVVAVGAATADAALAAGFAEVLAAGGDADATVAAVLARFAPGTTVVHVAGRDRTGAIAERLAAAGLAAATVEAYRAEMVDRLPAAVAADLAAGRFDVAIVASGRTAEAFRRSLVTAGLGPFPARPVLVALSAAAAAPLRDLFAAVEIADERSGDGLIERVVAQASAVADNR